MRKMKLKYDGIQFNRIDEEIHAYFGRNIEITDGGYFLPFLLKRLAPNSKIVYAAPETGKMLPILMPMIKGHQLILIENYAFHQEDKSEIQQQLRKNIKKIEKSIDYQFIEDDFVSVWDTLSNVDFLYLDGPPTTFNFNTFSDTFTYYMHDTYERLGLPFRETEASNPLFGLLDYLHIESDHRLLNCPEFERLSEDLRKIFLTPNRFRREDLFLTYGPYSWLIGEKETN